LTTKGRRDGSDESVETRRNYWQIFMQLLGVGCGFAAFCVGKIMRKLRSVLPSNCWKTDFLRGVKKKRVGRRIVVQTIAMRILGKTIAMRILGKTVKRVV